MNTNLDELNSIEIKDYIINLQVEVQKELSTNNDIDEFLDNTNIFDQFEELLPDEEFGVLILAVLNNFKSDVILDDLVNIIRKAVKIKTMK